jgi:hypothetical protein
MDLLGKIVFVVFVVFVAQNLAGIWWENNVKISEEFLEDKFLEAGEK